MTLSYRKHYPPGAAGAMLRRHLLALLRRTPGRRTRWHRQAKRRRPWLLRELTTGEKNLLQYKGLAEYLAGLLKPFRRTRPRGHRELQELLQDADTRPVVVAQVQALETCLDRIDPEYRRHGQQLDRWREQWPRLNVVSQQRLREVDKAVCISYCHDGIYLLVKEAKSDIEHIKRVSPEAFKPVPALEPLLDSTSPPNKPATPPPYS